MTSPIDGIQPANCKNGTTITSVLGLEYIMYCGLDFGGGDIDGGHGKTFEECLEACTRRKACYGASWVEKDKSCWFKGSGAVDAILTSDDDVVSAFNIAYQKKQDPRTIICPYPNMSKQKTKDGLEFTIYCGGDMDGNDIFPVDTATDPMMRTENFENCLENCARSHPLCTHVAFIADRDGGPWMNCYPKKDFVGRPRLATARLIHSARAVVPKLDEFRCGNSSQQSASDGRSFRTSCEDYRGINATDISPLGTYHTTTLENCLDQCGKNNLSCVAAVFDVGLWSGYQNCYLFDKIPKPMEARSNYTLIYLDSLASQYSPPPQRDSGSSSKAWIAGVVIPVVAAIVLYRFWWREQKAKKA